MKNFNYDTRTVKQILLNRSYLSTVLTDSNPFDVTLALDIEHAIETANLTEYERQVINLRYPYEYDATLTDDYCAKQLDISVRTLRRTTADAINKITNRLNK